MGWVRSTEGVHVSRVGVLAEVHTWIRHGVGSAHSRSRRLTPSCFSAAFCNRAVDLEYLEEDEKGMAGSRRYQNI